MAEGVVGMLIGKLGAALEEEASPYGASLLGEEASALNCLFGKIRDVKDELESMGMEGFLHGAEWFKDTDEETGIFVKKICGMAFEIEDVVDEFTYELAAKHEGFTDKMKNMANHVETWRRLAHKMQNIMLRLQGADRRKVRYDMRVTEKEGGSNGGHSKSAGQSSHIAREEDLVGIEKKKELLMHWLAGDLDQGSKISSVWGMGGVGKTTLVTHVYNTAIAKMEFDCCAWITVSNIYHTEDLLKKISSEFGISVDADNMDMRSLVEIIHNHLLGKRYILVLDDVWHCDVWFKIRNAFPEESIGRFVITTRMQEVALLATNNCTIELAQLDFHYSWQLFCKEAFVNNENKTCPEELADIAQMFVHKCGGLPIAIARLGRLLSSKHLTYSEWKNVYEELESQLTNDGILDVDTVLKVSLEDLPWYLKNCFLHCTIFPEDYLFNRKRLIRHWITAGFIKETGCKTLEEVAESYLNELVNRSLLQVVERNLCGRVRLCRMHAIIRFLALAKSTEENFCQVYNDSGKISPVNTRRLSVQCTSIQQLPESSAPTVRSLYVFKNDLKIDSLSAFLKSVNLLTTLDLQGVRIKRLPQIVFNLFNLRFLGLRGTDIDYLPKEIERLQNLEVLDAYNAKLLALPVEVAILLKLKYLYVVTIPQEADDRVLVFDGIQVPVGIGNLTELLALQLIECSTDILPHIGCLTKLRTFGIAKVRTKHSADLCGAIKKMVHLVNLSISSTEEKEVLELEILCLPHTISKIELGCPLSKQSLSQFISASSHLINLTQLKLAFSKLDEESFACLLNLHGLVVLQILKAYEGKELHFHASSLPKLKSLAIWYAPNLSKVAIEQGAMKNLVELLLRDCPELEDLPNGIEHLKTLEKVDLLEISDELWRKLQQEGDSNECNEDRMKISHVKWVTIT